MMRNESEEYYRTHPSMLTEQLYLSACRALTAKVLLDLGITSIVNATLEMPTVAYQKQDTIQIAVEDRVCSKLYAYFDLVADKIQQVHLSGGKILVYCRAGQSRSATLCIAYFMKYHSMSFDEAFQYVKERRPIIHPNIGFIRQLKEFEVKCKSRQSMTSLAIACTPLVPRKNDNIPVPFPLPLPAILSYANAEEDFPTENYELEEFIVAPLKAKKPKMLLHEPFCDLVETYQVASVSSCNKLSSSKPIPERLLFTVQEVGSVASQGQETVIDQTGVYDPAQRRNKCRTAFTRLTKPQDIPVSYLQIKLDLPILNDNQNKAISLTKQTCSSVISELLPICQVFEEVPVYCVGQISKVDKPATNLQPHQSNKLLSASPRPNKWSLQQPLSKRLPKENETSSEISDRVQIVVTKFLNCATSSIVQVLIDVDVPQAVPVKRVLTRTSSVNLKIKSPWGVSSWDKPKVNNNSLQKPTKLNSKQPSEVHEKPVKALVKWTPFKLACAEIASDIVIWNSSTNGFQVNHSKANKRVKVVGISETYLTISQPTVLQMESPGPTFELSLDNYHKLDFSIPKFENCNIVSCLKPCILGLEKFTTDDKMLVSKLHPYYTTVQKLTALELFRAEEDIRLKVQWFKAPELASKTQTLPLVRKESFNKINKDKKRKISSLTLKWAPVRCEQDNSQITMDMIDHFWKEETVVLAPSHVNVHYSQLYVVPMAKTELLGRFYVPHYNPVLLKRDSDTPFKALATIHAPFCYENNNFYSVPRLTHYNTVARKKMHLDFLGTAVSLKVETKLCEKLEEIPSEISDFNDIKVLLANNPSSPKCNIWFDIFKRTLIKLRPTYADIKYTLGLPTVETCCETPLEFTVHLFPLVFKYEFATLSNMHSSLSVPSVRIVQCIENFHGLDSIVKQKKQMELPIISFQEHYGHIHSYAPDVHNFAKPFASSSELLIPEYATSKVSFPNRLYTISQPVVMGLDGPLVYMTKSHHRVAFQRVTKLHGLVVHEDHVLLRQTAKLPSYQFVQDVEDWPDRLVHENVVVDQTCNVTEVDTLWFFAMQDLPAVTTTSAESDVEVSSAPAAGNFLLFLPDPANAELLGQENLTTVETDIGGQMPIINPEVVVAEVLQEIQDKNDNPVDYYTSEDNSKDKRVTFVDGNPDIFYGERRGSSGRLKVKTIYYGRDRSKSRSRLKDVSQEASKPRSGTRDRSASRYRGERGEAEVLRKLNHSVNESREILARRRAIETITSPAANRRHYHNSASESSPPPPGLQRSSRSDGGFNNRSPTDHHRSSRSRETLGNSGRYSGGVNGGEYSSYTSSRDVRSQDTRSRRYESEDNDRPRGNAGGQIPGSGLYGTMINLASSLLTVGRPRDPLPKSDRSSRSLIQKSKNFL